MGPVPLLIYVYTIHKQRKGAILLFLAQLWKLLRLQNFVFLCIDLPPPAFGFFFLFILSLDIFINVRKAVTSRDKEICGNITTQKIVFPCDLSADSCFTSLLSCSFKRRVEVGFLLRQPFHYLKADSV